MDWTGFIAGWNWDDFVVQGASTLLGGGLAAVVAFRVVRAESLRADRDRRAAEASLREDRQNAIEERDKKEAIRLRGVRGEAIGQLLAALLPRAEAGLAPDREMKLAILRLCFDGTPDSYDMFRWVHAQVAAGAESKPQHLAQTYDKVAAMLTAWIRPEDEQGVLAAIRRQLRDAGTGPD